MKRLRIIAILVFILCMGYSCKSKQEVVKLPTTETVSLVDNDEMMPDQLPVFSKGLLAYWVARNLTYPVIAMQNGIEGKVYIRFIIDEQGRMTEPGVIKSSGSSILDAEAMRVISGMPSWTPAKHDGKVVRVYYNVPVNFMLSR